MPAGAVAPGLDRPQPAAGGDVRHAVGGDRHAGGALQADVAQEPRELGVKTIEAISKHFAGGPVEKFIAVPVKIVDANSLK